MLTEVHTGSKSECYDYSKQLIRKFINFGPYFQKRLYNISQPNSVMTY
jgi:hypothetical protein